MIKIINLNEKTLEEIKINENNCINCKKCYNSCPMMSKYSSSPKELMKKIITDKGVDKNIPYSCSSCAVCNLKCPKDIKIKEMFYDMRKDIFNNDKKNINDIGYNSVKFHQINSFSPIFSKSFSNKSTKKLFFPGCSLASYSPEIVLKTYEYLKKIHLTKTHVFKYSPRKGTKAADMPNQLDGTVKDERSKALIELNDINEHAFTEKFIGRVMDVLIEKEIKDKPDYYEGYTRNYIKVIVHCMSADITGKIVDVEIKEAVKDYAIANMA